MNARPQFQVMPDLAPEDFEALKSDISDRGVLVPVEYDEDGNILDGHHRVRACQELGLVTWPRIVREGLDDEGKRTHARQLNIARRHLTQAQKRDLIADDLRANPSRTDRQIAAGLGIDHKTVGSVRAELQGRGEIPHVSSRTDTMGRSQPATKPPRPSHSTYQEPPEAEDDVDPHLRNMAQDAFGGDVEKARAHLRESTEEAVKQSQSGAKPPARTPPPNPDYDRMVEFIDVCERLAGFDPEFVVNYSDMPLTAENAREVAAAAHPVLNSIMELFNDQDT